MGLPRRHSGKESACQCKRHRFDPWVRQIPWRRAWQPNPVFLPGKFHAQRSLAGHSPRGHKESDMTEHVCVHNSLRLQSKVIFPFQNPNSYCRRPHPACLQEMVLAQSVLLLFPEVPRGCLICIHKSSWHLLAPGCALVRASLPTCVRGHQKRASTRE